MICEIDRYKHVGEWNRARDCATTAATTTTTTTIGCRFHAAITTLFTRTRGAQYFTPVAIAVVVVFTRKTAPEDTRRRPLLSRIII